MTGTAVGFMLLSMALIWGGLGLSIWRLRRDAREVGLDDAADE